MLYGKIVKLYFETDVKFSFSTLSSVNDCVLQFYFEELIFINTSKVWSYWKKKLHIVRATGDVNRFSFQSAEYRLARASEEAWGAGA